MLHLLKKSAFLVYRAGHNLVQNDGLELAGYLTFLALLALPPFLVLLVAATGFFGQAALGRHFIEIVLQHVPQDAVGSLRPRIEEITSGPPTGLLTISILGAIWTSSSAVEGIRTVLNRAYKVSEPPHFLLRRLLSILQVLLLMALVIIMMAGLVLVPLVLGTITKHTGLALPPAVREFLTNDFVYISAGLIFAAVASLYYWLPNIKQSLLAVIPGAVLVVGLWVLGAAAVTFYLDNISTVNIIYGSLSSFIATLIFFYVMNVIFIYGAEFNHQLLVVLGKRIVEKKHSAKSPDKMIIRNPKKQS